MNIQYEQILPIGIASPLQRTSSSYQIIPSSHHRRSTSSISLELSDQLQYRRPSSFPAAISAFLRSLLSIFVGPSLRHGGWLMVPAPFSAAPSLGRRVTGTLFGNRRGSVSFAVQDGPRSVPALVVELPLTTADLVKEMASGGLLRIALECEKAWRPAPAARLRLLREPVWAMYCNGRPCGPAVARTCKDSDWNVLSTVQSVSAGAGVIPVAVDGGGGAAAAEEEGVLLYMRARFERVVGNRDSVALYMLNPDGSGVPEFSVFLLRI